MHNMGLKPALNPGSTPAGDRAVTPRRFIVTLGLAVGGAIAGTAVAVTAPNEKLVLVTVVSDDLNPRVNRGCNRRTSL